MIESIVSLLALGIVVWLMWLARDAGANAEKAKQAEVDKDAISKANDARTDVATGGGVPIERDTFNRDNVRQL